MVGHLAAMSPPELQRAERTSRDVRITRHIAPLLRGADGAARRTYHRTRFHQDLSTPTARSTGRHELARPLTHRLARSSPPANGRAEAGALDATRPLYAQSFSAATTGIFLLSGGIS